MLNDLEKNLLSRAALGDLITRSAIKYRTRTALVSGDQWVSVKATGWRS